MKTLSLISIVLLCTLSCKKKEIQIEKIINYPAAFVVNGEDNTISIIDLKNNNVNEVFDLTIVKKKNSLSIINGFWSHHLDVSSDNSKIIVAAPQFDFTLGHDILHDSNVSGKGGIIVIDKNTGTILNRIDVPNINYNAKFVNQGREIWTTTTNHNGYLYIYDALTGNEIKSLPLGSDPTEIVFSSDGKIGFVALSQSGFVLAIDTEKKQIIKSIKVDLYPTNVWLGADRLIYVENKNRNSINIINPEELLAFESIDLDFTPNYIVFNILTNELWTCTAGGSKVVFFKKIDDKWEKKGTIESGDDAHAIAFSKDFKKAFVVNQRSGSVSVINCLNHTKESEIKVGNKPNGILLIE